MTTNNSSLLKTALLVDSLASFLCGIACILFVQAIAGFLGVAASWTIPVIGLVAVVYSIGLFLAVRSEPVHTGIARFAAYGNLVGVLVLAGLLFANLLPFTTAGKWALAIVADAGLVLVILQFLGLRKLAG